MDNIDLLIECGFSKPVSKLELRDKVDIAQAVALHKVILASFAELTQFKEGLSTLGVAEAMKDNPDILRCFFCSESKKILIAGMCCHILYILYCVMPQLDKCLSK